MSNQLNTSCVACRLEFDSGWCGGECPICPESAAHKSARHLAGRIAMADFLKRRRSADRIEYDDWSATAYYSHAPG